MSAVNKDIINVIKVFFKGSDDLCLLCQKVLNEAYGDDNSYVVSVGKTIKVGSAEAEPDFIIDSGEYGYYINLRTIHQLLEFHPYNERMILKRASEFRKAYEKTKKEKIVFVDSEIDSVRGKILDLGAVKEDGSEFHENNSLRFKEFVKGSRIICGHKIIDHDLKYIRYFFDDGSLFADTLLLSALLFPQRAHHSIEKDYKIEDFDRNNPMFDSRKTKALFYEEVAAFNSLNDAMKAILFLLLKYHEGFKGFFKYIHYDIEGEVTDLIRQQFNDYICRNADIIRIANQWGFELACVLMTLITEDQSVVFSPWLLNNYPKVDDVIKELRNTPCKDENCPYCSRLYNVKDKLKQYFGFDEFRTFEGRPLQEQSVTDAVQGKSFITVFPTGGGKSLAFQLPALIASEAENALTVVISPLQALMKDQVDSLESKWKINAVMINGLLDPVSRKEAIERIENGTANILYISPEALRNNTISRLIKSRVIARFVIDEAHCFSAWGQDFRVDYIYIGKFIRELHNTKKLGYSIPVSCFTATAGQKVLEDIHKYFQEQLGIDMDFILASPERKNLKYEVRFVGANDKYSELRNLIVAHNCPTIVYVFSVQDTYRIADRLNNDDIKARPFNGQMSPTEKQENQEAFLKNKVDVMVATSAFGMGVDKDNVGLVIHYQVPSSLEDYLQEAGRAGRNERIRGFCIALFDEKDIDYNFFILNQTKLSLKDIQNVWRAIINKSGRRETICVSSEELADAAGWTDVDNRNTSTEITTAIGALENAGYVERQNNVYRIYATGIIPKNMETARKMIECSSLIDSDEKLHAIRIMETLFTSKMIGKVQGEDSKRTDEIAEVLALEHNQVLHLIDLLREEKILADSQDMTAIISSDDTERKAFNKLNRSLHLEDFLIRRVLQWEDESIDFKEINEKSKEYGIGNVTPMQIRAILMHWAIRKYVRLNRIHSSSVLEIRYIESRKIVETAFRKRCNLCQFIISYLYELIDGKRDKDLNEVKFSLLDLKRSYEEQLIIHEGDLETSMEELRDALLYIQRIGAMSMEGGFFVLNQRMKIKRIEMNNRIRYKKDDYKNLENHYKQKRRQIHIMAAYAKVLKDDPEKAKSFVNDYFAFETDDFDRKYFTKEQIQAMQKNISPKQYMKLFGHLSEVQKNIIDDADSNSIVVAAGPGSGKTMVLVHKLASLILLEDVKCEKLLMLTFSRLAATEFKKRLIKLIGPPAYYVEIKTFHSYCFDILGRKGNIIESNDIEKEAVQMIISNEIERERINKAVLVVDEAQDMSEDESNLIDTMIKFNEDMRVILVGDDDQNIFEFRGSSSEYMKRFITKHDARTYSMIDNFRSDRSIVGFANLLVKSLSGRIKTEPGRSVSTSNGSVVLAKYRSCNLETP